jgi:hypothetical protein
MSDGIKSNFKNVDTWIRFGYMLLFAVVYNLLEIILLAVVLFQAFLTLITGSRNQRLLRFGGQLSTFFYQILQYLTYNSDETPFPFAEWPSNKSSEKKSPATDARSMPWKKRSKKVEKNSSKSNTNEPESDRNE